MVRVRQGAAPAGARCQSGRGAGVRPEGYGSVEAAQRQRRAKRKLDGVTSIAKARPAHADLQALCRKKHKSLESQSSAQEF